MEQQGQSTLISDSACVDGIRCVRLESEHLVVDVAPSVGGRIIGIAEKKTGHQFLWRNHSVTLQQHSHGTSYDPNFYGGIDEIIPNDIVEEFHGKALPDHGEMWTTPLSYTIFDDSLELTGDLSVSGLRYKKKITLRSDTTHCDMDYLLHNPTNRAVSFQWKLHAALNIAEGDKIVCPAACARVADLAFSRYKSEEPFDWPKIEGRMADVIPAQTGGCDAFYLWGLAAGIFSWQNADETLTFGLCFDTDVFSYAYYFASYGGFLDHRVAVLEPCAAMPDSLTEAESLGQCMVLGPGESLETRVAIYAGSMSPARV